MKKFPFRNGKRPKILYLFSIFFVFNRFDAGDRSTVHGIIEFCVFGITTRIAQKWIFFVVIYSSEDGKHTKSIDVARDTVKHPNFTCIYDTDKRFRRNYYKRPDSQARTPNTEDSEASRASSSSFRKIPNIPS